MSVDLSTPVLVVNDYQTMRSVVTTLLMQIGFEHVDGADGGLEALRKLRDKTYGLVIADSAMKPMSGDELLQTIYSDPDLSAVPFLMLTAPHTPKALPAPADAIAKPFNARTLQDKIVSMLAA
jgi:two-component system chemotaxis response regulator CheY